MELDGREKIEVQEITDATKRGQNHDRIIYKTERVPFSAGVIFFPPFSRGFCFNIKCILHRRLFLIYTFNYDYTLTQHN